MDTSTAPDERARTTIVDRVRRRPVLFASLAIGAIGAVVIVLWWFQPQALLFDTVVDEDFPTVEAGGDADDLAGDDMAGDDMAGDADDLAGDDGMSDGTMEDTADPADEMAGDPQADAADAPAEPVALASGSFVSRNRYTVVGDATVYELVDGSRVLRLEDFESTNGPDLFVYLTAADQDDSDGTFDEDAVGLGVLTGNVGNQNYDIPADVDLDHYDTVVIWCRRFTTSFGAADLS